MKRASDQSYSTLLLCICQKQVEDALLLKSCAGLNWDDFLRQLRWHRVAPLAWKRLKAVTHVMPPSIASELYALQKSIRLHSLRLSSELFSLGDTLKHNGISFTSIKGPLLSQKLYADISMRYSKDIDILIAPEDFERCNHLLLGMGYIRKSPDTRASKRAYNAYCMVYKDMEYVHPKKKVHIELHSRLDDNHYLLDGLCEMQCRDRRDTTVMCPVHEFIYLCVHGAASSWARLSWLTDIDRYVALSTLDWQKVAKEARFSRVCHLVFTALRLAHTLLKTGIPTEIRTTVRENMASNIIINQALAYNKSGRYPHLVTRHIYRGLFTSRPRYQALHWVKTMARILFRIFPRKIRLHVFYWVTYPFVPSRMK